VIAMTAEVCMRWKDAVQRAIVRVAGKRSDRMLSLAELKERGLTQIVRDTGRRNARVHTWTRVLRAGKPGVHRVFGQ